MKLDHLPDLTDGGKYANAWPTQLIRLYDFDEQQNQQLLTLLQDWLADGQGELALDAVPFIQAINCQLALRIAPVERGIRLLAEPQVFVCEFTRTGFRHALANMQQVGDGYAWLDELSDSPTEFLYSPGGTW